MARQTNVQFTQPPPCTICMQPITTTGVGRQMDISATEHEHLAWVCNGCIANAVRSAYHDTQLAARPAKPYAVNTYCESTGGHTTTYYDEHGKRLPGKPS